MTVHFSEFETGPCVLVIEQPEDGSFPAVVSPPGGFPSQQEAEDYVNANFKDREEPYLGLVFRIVPLWNQATFNRFCSWED